MCSMAQATRHGFRASLAGVAGIQAGNLLFFLAVGLGLGTLLATATTAFTFLRIAGAIYLFYLGVKILASTLRRDAPGKAGRTNQVVPHRSLFFQGLFIQLTNPKALLFVSALLPQFVDASGGVWAQLSILCAVTITVDAVVLSGYAYVAHKGARSAGQTTLAKWLERAFGATLIFFGARLLVAPR
jgi:homoserine/homoserine lactone efflux protein